MIVIVSCRGSSVLSDTLPPRFEYAVRVNITALQSQLYSEFFSSLPQGTGLFDIYAQLRLLCNHPEILRKVVDKVEVTDIHKGTSDDAEITETESDVSEDDFGGKLPASIRTRLHEHWKKSSLFSPDYESEHSDGSKISVLIKLLKQFHAIGDKTVIFSRSLPTLDYISEVCKSNGFSILRLDGSVLFEERSRMIDVFNDSKSKPTIFLASTQAGGEGINLIGANRCILFDVSFNPCSDGQAARRVYRFGQVKPVFIYRFVANNTMESIVFNRLVARDSMVLRVVDKVQVKRLFTRQDLSNLFHNPANNVESTAVDLNSIPSCDCSIESCLQSVLDLATVQNYDTLLSSTDEEKFDVSSLKDDIQNADITPKETIEKKFVSNSVSDSSLGKRRIATESVFSTKAIMEWKHVFEYYCIFSFVYNFRSKKIFYKCNFLIFPMGIFFLFVCFL